MKRITIKIANGDRYDLPPNQSVEVVERYGMYFIRLESGETTRYINCQHIVSIKEVEE